MAGTGTKLFLLIVCLNIMFYIITPVTSQEYFHVEGDLFEQFLTKGEDNTIQINRTNLQNDTFLFVADTAESGGTVLSRFIDPIKAVFGGFNAMGRTLINVAIAPVSLISTFIGNPLYVALFGIPIMLLYLISFVAFIRGSQW